MGLFDSIRSARNAAQKKLDGLREAMDAAMRKRDELIAAPAPRSDVQVVIRDRIASAAAGYADGVQASLRPLLNTPNDLQVPSIVARLSLVGSGRAPGDALSVAEFERVLAALFPAELQRAIDAALDAMPQPAAEGLPLAERPDAIAQLSATVDALRTELNALRKEAQEAGIELE